MKSLLDPTFRYTNSASTDIRKTFAKERRRLADEAERERIVAQTNAAKVRVINKGKA